MLFEIALLLVGVLLAFGEFYVWYSEILWHGEAKQDPRNSPPR